MLKVTYLDNKYMKLNRYYTFISIYWIILDGSDVINYLIYINKYRVVIHI